MMIKIKNKNQEGKMKKALGKQTANLTRLFPSYLICFVPFLFFGTKQDIRLILWKIAVVGTGLLIFHYIRKSMFHYVDLQKAYEIIFEEKDETLRLHLVLLAIAKSILVSALAFSILFSIAGGI